jgi:hypothetical protein
LSAAELIAILVRTGLRGVNALDIGKQLIQRFGSLGAMARASVDELQCIRGIPRRKTSPRQSPSPACFIVPSVVAPSRQRCKKATHITVAPRNVTR